jgi:hypothetical protein
MHIISVKNLFLIYSIVFSMVCFSMEGFFNRENEDPFIEYIVQTNQQFKKLKRSLKKQNKPEQNDHYKIVSKYGPITSIEFVDQKSKL